MREGEQRGTLGGVWWVVGGVLKSQWVWGRVGPGGVGEVLDLHTDLCGSI